MHMDAPEQSTAAPIAPRAASGTPHPVPRSRRVAGWLDRLESRPVRYGLLALGLAAGAMVWYGTMTATRTGWDAHAYWVAPLDNPYAVSAVGAPDAYLYSPAFRQLIAPIVALSWPAFLGTWEAGLIAVLIGLTGPLAPFVLAIPLVPYELQAGNIHVLLAAAVVVGFRYPAAWSFVLLTKVTPGIGLLWFAFRREWRSLAIALGATAAIVVASFVLAPALWGQWIDVLVRNAQSPAEAYSTGWLPPLWMRLPVSVLLLWAGAQSNRRWTVPVAATIAIPALAAINLVMLVAVIPLVRGPVVAWLRRPRVSAAT